MQSTRFLAANMLRQQAAAASPLLRSRAVPMLRSQPIIKTQPSMVRTLRLQATPKMRMPVPVSPSCPMYINSKSTELTSLQGEEQSGS